MLTSSIGDVTPFLSISVIVVVVVVVLVVIVIGGVLIYLWRWRKEQAKMEQLWLLQLERANNVSNNMIMPFRAVSISSYFFQCESMAMFEPILSLVAVMM